MAKVLITGMSGTGKSTALHFLRLRGHSTVDTDTDTWSHWVTQPDGSTDWIWRDQATIDLLSSHNDGNLFVAGCKTNQGRFYPLFDQTDRTPGRARSPSQETGPDGFLGGFLGVGWVWNKETSLAAGVSDPVRRESRKSPARRSDSLFRSTRAVWPPVGPPLRSRSNPGQSAKPISHWAGWSAS
ncbi:hypothetical protein ACWENS_39765 [Streptomyces sp. NPDC004532]